MVTMDWGAQLLHSAYIILGGVADLMLSPELIWEAFGIREEFPVMEIIAPCHFVCSTFPDEVGLREGENQKFWNPILNIAEPLVD